MKAKGSSKASSAQPTAQTNPSATNMFFRPVKANVSPRQINTDTFWRKNAFLPSDSSLLPI